MAPCTTRIDLCTLLENGRVFKYHKGQVLLSSDDNLKLSLVKSGFVKRYLISNDGSHSVQSIYGAGDIFPLTHVYKVLLNQEIYLGQEIYYYETLTDTEIYMVDNETLIAEVTKNPLLYRDLFAVAGQRLKSNIQALENLSLHTAYQKVAHLLATYASNYGTRLSIGTRIDLPVTHLLIANVLDITRETVSQSIIQLRENKLIKTGKFIVIPNIPALEEAAYN